MKHKLFTLLLISVLIISSFSFVFATDSIVTDFSEPTSDSNNGWILLWLKSSNSSDDVFPRIYKWSATPDMLATSNNVSSASGVKARYELNVTSSNVNLVVKLRSVEWGTQTSYSVPISGTFNVLYDSGTVETTAILSKTDFSTSRNTTYKLVGYDFGGAAELVGFDNYPLINAEWNQRTIVDYLSDILTTLKEVFVPSDEPPVSDLPSQSVDDLEGSQGSLRDESDVSSDIGVITDGFDFSPFSNAFGVVWSICESILLTHTTLMSLLFLVLTLGVLNLILSRR